MRLNSPLVLNFQRNSSLPNILEQNKRQILTARFKIETILQKQRKLKNSKSVRIKKIKQFNIDHFCQKLLQINLTFPAINIIYCSKFIHNIEWAPSFRYSTVVVNPLNKVLMFGGLGNKVSCELFQLNCETKKWKEIEYNQKWYLQGRYGHTGVVRRKQIIITGGTNRKQIFSDIMVFNIENSSWSFIKASGNTYPRKYHASCLLVHFQLKGNKNLIVSGGVTYGQKYLKQVSLFNFDKNSWINLYIEQQIEIAFHAACMVFQNNILFSTPYQSISLKTPNKNKSLKQEGMYIFGGKDSNGMRHNKLIVLKFGLKPLIYKQLKCKGSPPEARYQHCMHFFQKLQLLFIYGGKCDSQKRAQAQIFSSCFVMDLGQLEWKKLQNRDGNLQKRFAFGSTLNQQDNQIIIFGGITADGCRGCQTTVLSFLDNYNTSRIKRKKEASRYFPKIK